MGMGLLPGPCSATLPSLEHLTIVLVLSCPRSFMRGQSCMQKEPLLRVTFVPGSYLCLVEHNSRFCGCVVSVPSVTVVGRDLFLLSLHLDNVLGLSVPKMQPTPCPLTCVVSDAASM